MRIIVRFEKGEELRYISHLDIQRAFHRAIRRSGLPIAYSQGFNPHLKTSFASALPVGQTGKCEWMEIKLEEGHEISPDEVRTMLNQAFMPGLTVSMAIEAPEGYPSLTSAMQSADYSVLQVGERTFGDISESEFQERLEEFLSKPILVDKRKKSKGKAVVVQTDIRPMLYSMVLSSYEGNIPRFEVSGRLDASGGLNVDLLLQAFNAHMNVQAIWQVQREAIRLQDGIE